jgi:pimeloyl-ACP methyl ester carboxylesterase
MTIHSKRLSVNGIELAYDDTGAGDRAFVLVHGFTGCREDFTSRLPALATLGRTVAPDQRGHGDSTNTGDPATYRFAQLVDDLRAFADALGLERFDLLGHSMGGMVALRFVLAHPERVASLVLMDTAPAPLGAGLPREMFEKGARIARATSMEKLHEILRERAADNPVRTEADRRLEAEWGADRYWERQRRRFTAMDVEAFESLGIELGASEPVTDRLGEIRCPTLVLVGETDVPFLEPSRVMHERIPGATLAVIPGGGHSPQIEAPEAWHAAIAAHLRRARAS